MEQIAVPLETSSVISEWENDDVITTQVKMNRSDSLGNASENSLYVRGSLVEQPQFNRTESNMLELAKANEVNGGSIQAGRHYFDLPPVSMMRLNQLEASERRGSHDLINGFNDTMEHWKRVIITYSIYFALHCFLIAVFSGLASFLHDDWRFVRINHAGGSEGAGTSTTVLGLTGLKRFDKIKQNSSLFMTYFRGISYGDLTTNSFCGGGWDSIRKAASPMEYLLFRPIDKVGANADIRDACFREIHGPSVYDVLCSSINETATAGMVILVMGAISFVLFLFMSYFFIKRLLHPYSHNGGAVSKMIGYLGNVLWVSSILLAVVGFIVYISLSDGSACINDQGSPAKCELYFSSYFFVAYICFNALSYIGYVLHGFNHIIPEVEHPESKV